MQQTGTSRIKTQRLKKGWTLRDLAAFCADEGAPIDFGQLSKIERQINIPHPRTRAVLARLLDLDIDEFERAS